MLGVACKKLGKYNNPDLISNGSWNPELAVPLAFAEFGVYDILAQTDSTDLLVIDPNSGQLALVYKGELVSFSAENFISIPDLLVQVDFSSSDLSLAPIPVFSSTATVTQDENLVFPLVNGVEFHTVKFKGGSLNLSLVTDFKHDINITVLFPGLIKNGNAVSVNLNGTYTGNSPTVVGGTLDLTGVSADLTLAGTVVNTFKAEITTTISGTGAAIVGTESISLNMDFVNLAYENATGYFGNQNFDLGQDSILIKIFNNALDGYFELTNPKIKLEMVNSFGFPVQVALNNLRTENVINGNTFVLSGYQNPIDILAPQIMGDAKTTILELNSTNTSNISSIITPTPKYFYYEAEATSNPNGPTANLNFILDTSKFKINAELELPLEGFAYGFEFKDTLAFDFTDDIAEVSAILFRIIINNGFPVNVSAKINFTDEHYVSLLEITDGFELVVASGEVNADGIVTSPTEKLTDLVVERSDLPNIDAAKHIIITVLGETTDGNNGQVVKMLDTYKIGLNLGMKVTGSVQL
ncbi:hypothetical protein DNU06_10420 [Putridiphycobacter roseus]|uniref:Uncharacterized protein n=2 Tax=Putridiphycobacter roseus TaxID=2219161 RepID=A0A2W1MZ24_9FLAO|nr:hypothetical protein DNU06_10420 [Putridiphycobacter roseus]